jgi:hypothetical protein
MKKMIDIIAGGGVTSIIMSTKDADFLARELHSMELENAGESVLYEIYDALVPMGDDDE